MCIHINDTHEIIICVVSKQITHVWWWRWVLLLSITALTFVLVDEEESMFACVVDIICDKLKQKPWIVAVYWSLQRKIYAKYVNNQQCEGTAVNDKINKIAVVKFSINCTYLCFIWWRRRNVRQNCWKICDKIKQQTWIVAVYWSLVQQMYCKYLNNRQREVPAVRCRLMKIISYML